MAQFTPGTGLATRPIGRLGPLKTRSVEVRRVPDDSVGRSSAALKAIKTHLASDVVNARGRGSFGLVGESWRYRAIQISNEEDEVARLRYLLAAGVKEQLVEKAIEWPGVHSARALTRDHLLRGWWFDRSREFAARRRREPFGRYEYATEETVILDPLPCWRHLSTLEIRRRVKELIRDIEREAAVERRRTGKPVRGAEAVMEIDPHFRPTQRDRSPAPDFHARRKDVRKAMRYAYTWVVVEHARAAERLRAGELRVSFPEGTFPPGLPFVPFPRGRPP